MRKLQLIIAGMLLCTVLSFGQSRTVTGVVKDSQGNPVPYASVVLKGDKTGVSADAEGRFSINAKTGDKLVISAIGLTAAEISVGAGNTVGVVLNASGQDLSEVVVTALGIKRLKNSLPYAAQSVAGDDVSKLRGGNAAQALSGKVAGLEIRQGNGIGGSTNVVVRGTKSLSYNNQALFVIDGVPFDNSTSNSNNQRTGRGGYDYGNAGADINPDDIETMTVLKGAAATALYGSRAANGVIMITSKKARRGLGITVNSGITVGSIDKSTYVEYQKEYGAGYSSPYDKDGFFYFDVNGDGTKDLVVPTTEDASYGAKFDPNLQVYHWDAFEVGGPNYHKTRPWVAAQNSPESFYINPVSNNQSIMVDGASDKGSFKLGYVRNDEKGVLPNSSVLKNILNFGATYAIVPKLVASASVNFSQVNGKGRYGTGYDGRNVNQTFRQWHQTNVDMEEQKAAYFRKRANVTWNWADPSDESNGMPIYTDNYYWTMYENFQNDTRTRTFGNVSLNYQATDWLSFLGRVSVDTYNEFQEERLAVGSIGVPFYSRFDRKFREINYDLMANLDKNLTEDINLKAVLGTNIRRSHSESIFAQTNGGLVVPGIYSLGNSTNSISAPTETYAPIAVDGYFAGVTLGYKDFITLDGTFRRDRSSTLPEANNAYNYYAVSGSWLFSKHLGTAAPWLSTGKLRLNYATVGSDAPWGILSDVYFKPDLFGSAILYSLPARKNNNNLVPENTISKEIGLDMAFLRNRIGFDFTYYHTNTLNQIIPVAVSGATGYDTKVVNAGNVENKGIELSIFASPFKNKDFSWDVNLNFTQNRNKVVSLYDQSKNLQINPLNMPGGVTINATLGQPYGTIQGKTWVMQDGQKVVGSNGRYVQTTTTNNIIGNVNPDWIGGVYNTFRYKGVSLGFLVDVRKGGSVFSLDQYYGMATGVSVMTTGLNDLGNPSRNTIANGGGIIMPGVTADGKPNTKRVENVYGTYGYSYNPQHAFVYDASYVKLREVVLSYAIPAGLVAKTKVIKGAELSLIGRNLWLIHKNLPYSDPEENMSAGNVQGYQGGAYPTTRSIGLNLKLKL